MLQKFKNILINDLEVTFQLKDITEKEHIIDLTSSTITKFSHHIIVNHHDLVFANNYHVGRYAKYLCDKLKLDQDMSIVLKNNFGVTTNKSASITNDIIYGTFVDEGVYTKNRNFRLYLSAKFNKTTCLELAKNVSKLSDRCIFFNSLVTNVSGCGSYHRPNILNERPQYIKFECNGSLPPSIAVTEPQQNLKSSNKTALKQTRYLTFRIHITAQNI